MRAFAETSREEEDVKSTATTAEEAGGRGEAEGEGGTDTDGEESDCNKERGG